MVGVLTPWKLANATIQGFSLPREPLLKHLAAFTVYSVISPSLFIFKSSDYVEQPCRILFPDISFPHLKHSVCHLIYHLPTEWLSKLLSPSVLQSPYLYDRDNNSTYLRINVKLNKKYIYLSILPKCLVHSKYSSSTTSFVFLPKLIEIYRSLTKVLFSILLNPVGHWLRPNVGNIEY